MNIIEIAESRLLGAISTLRSLKRASYPQPDSNNALRYIEKKLSTLLAELRNIKTDPVSKHSELEVSRTTIDEVSRCLPHLGRVFQSRSPILPFELCGLLKSEAKRIVTREIDLIIHSDWSYNASIVHGQPREPIFIGFPASECESCLLIPVAGHEIGHKIYRSIEKDGIAQKYFLPTNKSLQDAANDVLKKNPDIYAKLRLPLPSDQPDVFTLPIIGDVVRHATNQLQEIFCDHVALRWFGDSYARAFSRLFAPDLQERRDRNYPSSIDRIEYLEKSANKWGLPWASWISGLWAREISRQDPILPLIDQVVGRFVDHMRDLVEHWFSEIKISAPDEGNVVRCIEALKKLAPIGFNVTLAEMIRAMWEMSEQDTPWTNYPELEGQKKLQVLNELVLKSAQCVYLRTELDYHDNSRPRFSSPH